MMARWHESLWPTLEELGIGYMAFSPLANGFLTGNVQKGMQAGFDGKAGDYRANIPQFKDENIEKSQALLDLLDEMATAHGCSVPQLSLAWMICKKPWLVPIPGSRKAERIAQNAAAGDVVLSADEISRIDTALDGMDFEVFGGNAAAKKWRPSRRTEEAISSTRNHLFDCWHEVPVFVRCFGCNRALPCRVYICAASLLRIQRLTCKHININYYLLGECTLSSKLGRKAMASTDAQVVHATYQSMYRFMVARDVERLGALLDDSFVLVHMTGRRQPKAEFLASVATGELRYFSEVEESCPVHVDGNTASCRGRSLVEASPFGAGRSTWRLQQDLDFVRSDGRWLIKRTVASMY